MCGKKAPAPAPVPVAVPDPTVANRGSSEPTTVGTGRRIASTDGDGITGGLASAEPSGGAAPVAKSVLGG